jgi:uncharacterized protein (TIGR03435 family)
MILFMESAVCRSCLRYLMAANRLFHASVLSVHLLGCLALLCSGPVNAWAQEELKRQRPFQPAGFTSISIGPHKFGHNNAGQIIASFAGIRMTGVSVEDIIRFAYPGAYEIAGLPGWCPKTSLDVLATTDGRSSLDLTRLNTGALLQDRFHFSFHRETKDRLVYRLIVGPNPKFTPTSTEMRERIRPIDVQSLKRNGEDIGVWVFGAAGVAIDQFAVWASNLLDLPVVDGTGLEGRFDFTFSLECTYDQPITWRGDGRTKQVRDPGKWIASMEDAGFRFVKVKAPLETMYVDQLEKPNSK